VYNILCDSLGVDPHPSNGTLRLPFKPIGLHSDEDAPVLDTPPDPPAQTSATAEPSTSAPAPAPQPTTPSETPPATDNDSDSDGDNEKGTTWLDSVWDKLDDFKHWAGGVADAIKGNHPESQG
jgi:hypothetical protein